MTKKMLRSLPLSRIFDISLKNRFFASSLNGRPYYCCSGIAQTFWDSHDPSSYCKNWTILLGRTVPWRRWETFNDFLDWPKVHTHTHAYCIQQRDISWQIKEQADISSARQWTDSQLFVSIDLQLLRETEKKKWESKQLKNLEKLILT